jgi:hypothetical protein
MNKYTVTLTLPLWFRWYIRFIWSIFVLSVYLQFIDHEDDCYGF